MSSLHPCNTHFFPWHRRSHHQRWVSFYKYHFIYHLHLAETGKCSFTTNNFLVNGRFPSRPLSTACLRPPLCFLPSCFPRPHHAVALLGLAASHCPILGCSWQGHPLPAALTTLQAHGDNPGLSQSVTMLPGWQHGQGGVWKWVLPWKWKSRKHIHKGNSIRVALLQRRQQRTGKGLQVGFGATEKTEWNGHYPLDIAKPVIWDWQFPFVPWLQKQICWSRLDVTKCLELEKHSDSPASFPFISSVATMCRVCRLMLQVFKNGSFVWNMELWSFQKEKYTSKMTGFFLPLMTWRCCSIRHKNESSLVKHWVARPHQH